MAAEPGDDPRGDHPPAADAPGAPGEGAGGAAPYDKTMSSFNPLATLGLDECERHYTTVHTRWARHLLRDRPHVVSYHIDRARGAYDVRGGFGQRPDAWRWVVLRLAPGRRLGLSLAEQEQVVQDHRNCLRDVRSFTVDERIVVDERRGQTTLVKYLFDLERTGDGPVGGTGGDPAIALEEDRRRFDSLAAALAEQARAGDHGLRLLLQDIVTREQATEPVDEPGQRPVGRVLEQSTKIGFLELYFDQQEWAEDLFGQLAIRQLLRPAFARVRGYRVEEGCGFDHR